jgi:hypothetical protein
MKLWILKPNANDKLLPNPWEPWYDKAFAFVIRANTESEARQIADKSAGDENSEIANLYPWLNSTYSTCLELKSDGESGMILRDFASA